MKTSDLNKESTYPNFCCEDCLLKAGGHLNTNDTLTTECKCEVCGKVEKCFSPKDFSYPCFSSLAFKEILSVGLNGQKETYQCN